MSGNSKYFSIPLACLAMQCSCLDMCHNTNHGYGHRELADHVSCALVARALIQLVRSSQRTSAVGICISDRAVGCSDLVLMSALDSPDTWSFKTANSSCKCPLRFLIRRPSSPVYSGVRQKPFVFFPMVRWRAIFECWGQEPPRSANVSVTCVFQ